MSNTKWYIYSPADTILVRGAEEDNASLGAVFPPPAHTISGAVRTAYLREQGVDYRDYREGRAGDAVYKAIGRHDGLPPFQVLGPLFQLDGKIYAPAPASWYLPGTAKGGGENAKAVPIQARPLSDSEKNWLAADTELYWADRTEGQMQSLAGRWVELAVLTAARSGQAAEFKKADDFYSIEPRTGVALDTGRMTREGRLYFFNHVRLAAGVSIVFGLAGAGFELPGLLRLGAEQRFGSCKAAADFPALQDSGAAYLALGPIPFEGAEQEVVAGGKPQYLGGWDLAKGFHKPMRAHYPAGTVFKTKVHANTMALA